MLTADRLIEVPDDPERYVEGLALDYLRLAAREPKRIGRRDLKLTATATAEYEGRFLVELIQNAYDAHTAARNDGLIVVDFDPDDGQFGTLWVANAGFPFGVSNVAAISEIGNSDKRPDQGVGNKGVGFRAVLRICEWPEIYSSRVPGADDGFAGFRFGFAHATDIDRLKAIVESEGNAVPKVSPYCVVVPMTDTPAGLDVFARRGLATVIRLPLRSREAAVMVRQEVEWLTGSERPLLLFLDRIGRLEVTMRPGVPVAQTRAVRRLAMTPREVAIDQVDLDPGGSFILASRVVPASSVREAIGATVKAGLLDDEWLEWNEPVTVSMAVAVGGDGRTGVFYTYLPMDHAAAPGASHVNAPFITKMARRDLDPDVPVNALYIREAAGIAIEAGYWARSTLLDPAVVVDFTAWEVRYASQFDQAAAAVPQKESALVLPANGRAARWLLLTDSRHWAPDGTTVFGPDRVSELPGSRLIDGSLGSNRIERLEQIMRKRVGRSMTPDPEELAEWAEELAAAQRSNVGWEVWDQFYGDIARVFNRTAIHLIGRKILIDEDARLREGAGRSDRRGDRRAAAVFFPPLQLGQAESAEGEANAADIPSSLRDRLVYMNRHLTWFESLPSGGRRARPARGFLESSGLVQEFRTETLLDYTRDISARTRSDAVRSDLLLWSYRLVKAMRGDAPPALDRLGLRVPTRSGWVASSESVFGPEWADEGGANLSALISATSGSIPELARMPERFLLPPTRLPFPIADHGEAVDFLKRLGVQSGLRPVAGETSWPLTPGGQLTPTWIASRSEMSEVLASWWVGRLDAHGYRTHRYEDYRITSQLWRWPAQESFSGLPLTAKRLYAVLVLNAIPALRDEQRYLSIGRPTGYARDPQQWPTPAQVFLEEELWLPMGHPNERHVYRYGRPAKTWHADDADEQPDFAPLLAGEFARRVRADNELRQQLLDLGLKLWADRDYAGDQIEFMGDLIDSDYPSEARAASFKKAYARAWQDAIAAGHPPFAGESPEVAKVVVTRSGRLEAVDLLRKDGAFDVYVQDTDESTVTRLIDELSWPYMRFERDGAAAVEILKRLAPDRVRPTSEVDLRVLVDSEVFRPSDEAELLTGGDRVWIRDLVLLVHEFQPRAADALVRTQASQRRVAEALERVRVKRAATLQLRLGGAPVGTGVRPNRPLALRDDKYPTLVVVQEPEWSWSMLAHGARGLSELVGQPPAFSSHLELVVTKISHLSPMFTRPDDEVLAEALDVDVRHLLEARAEFQSSMASVLFRLVPVVCVYAGSDAALRFMDRDDLTTTDGIQREISGLNNVSLTNDVIAVCSEPLTLPEVRDKLGIGYKQFNEALIALTPTYHPLLNEDGHRLAVEAWVRANRDRLLPRVVAKYALAFDQYGDMSGYASERDLHLITPDPAWLIEFEVPPEHVIADRAERQLDDAGAPRRGVERLNVAEVFADNRDRLARMLEAVQPIIEAWAKKHAVQTPTGWSQDDRSSVIRKAENLGIFDFRALTDQELLRWLAALGVWPSGMPSTFDLTELGLTSEDLAAERSAAAREAAARTEAKNSLQVGGTTYNVGAADVAQFVEAIRGTINDKFLRSGRNFAKTSPTQSRGIPRDGHGRGGGGAEFDRLSDAQRRAIGLAGEIAAFHWLRRRYPSCDESSWKSTNAGIYLKNGVGDDSLGYDFEVLTEASKYFFEVKASPSAEKLEFEMGETEVKKAQSVADAYRILYIRDALSATRSILQLRNPFSTKGRSAVKMVGTGVRFRFRLDEEA